MSNGVMGKIGSWSFILGIIIALIFGLWQAVQLEGGHDFFITDTGGIIAWILAILGVVVGVLAVMGKGTITKGEIPGFLLAAIGLVVMYGVFKGITLKPWIGSLLNGLSLSISIFVAPAVGILAIKAIWDIGRSA
ncbi:MAG: hypothetical protein ACQXXF_04280 [Thermoplasmatota archaeon]|jgi:hypothetical protein